MENGQLSQFDTLGSIGNAVEHTEDFKVLLLCLIGLGELLQQGFLTDLRGEQDDYIGLCRRTARISAMLDRINTSNRWLSDIGAYRSNANQSAPAKWASDQIIETSVRIESEISSEYKTGLLTACEHFVELRTLSLALDWLTNNGHRAPNWMLVDLFSLGINWPVAFREEKSFLQASAMGNTFSRIPDEDVNHTFDLDYILDRELILGGRAFYEGWHGENQNDFKVAAEHYERIVRYFSSGLEESIGSSPFEFGTSTFGNLFGYLEHSERERGRNYLILMVDPSGTQTIRVILPRWEHWFVQPLTPAAQADYHKDPVSFIRIHAEGIASSFAINWCRSNAQKCRDYERELVSGKFIQEIAQRADPAVKAVAKTVALLIADYWVFGEINADRAKHVALAQLLYESFMLLRGTKAAAKTSKAY